MTPRTRSKTPEVHDLITKVRAEAAQIMVDCPKTRARVTRVIRLLGGIEDAWHDARVGSKPKRNSSRGATITGYAIENWQGKPHLVEMRDSGAQPFRTPRSHYKAVVDILATASEPMRFEEIRTLTAGQLGLGSEDELPIYRLRIVMRFLDKSRLLIHESRQYQRAGAASGFRQGAARAWKALASTIG